MSYTSEEFPNSAYYRSDLREILNRLREIDATIATYDDAISELQQSVTDIATLKIKVANLEKATSDLPIIRNQITQLIKEDSILQEEIDQIKVVFTGIITSIENLNNKIDSRTNLLRSEFNAGLFELSRQMEIIRLNLEDEIDNLTEYVNWLVTHLSTDVLNPLWYERMLFDTNNAQIYTDLAYGALTVAEYKELNLSVQDYFNRGLNVVRYYLYGRFDLAKAHWTVGQVSGIRKSVANAINEAITFICNTLTTSEYLNLDITSTEYDELDLTVEDYFRYNPSYISGHLIVSESGTGLSSEQYSHIQIV